MQTADPIRLIEEAAPDTPFVVAQLGQSLDGRIATVSGESRWINGRAALDHLHAVRAAVDAVVVGIGTVVADDPQLNVRRVPLPAGRSQPARIVIDPSGRLPRDARLLADTASPCLVINASDCTVTPVCEAIRLHRTDGQLNPDEIVTHLFQRGFKRLLIEGGARTVSSFIDAGLVDRLHVLVAPMIIGSGKTGLDLRQIERLDRALRPTADVKVLSDGDVLFDCDLRAGHGKLAGGGS